ncbi:MAG: hypothetical protein ACOYOL_05935 [Chthoniobacterales bacterium]
MKLIKTLALTAAVLGTAVGVQAQTTIDITGSTAGRSAVHNAILAALTSDTYVFNGNNLNAAGRVLFRGNLGTNSVVIRTAWSGSAAGVRDVAQNNASVWFINNGAIGAGALNNSVITTGNTAASVPTFGNLVQDTPEIAFSDVFQSSTIYTSPGLADALTGIIPFKFYASKDAPTNLVNISPLAARFLFGSGYIPLSMLTGLAGDASTYAFATGRDPESGTRITAMAEIGYGVFGAVQQYQPAIGGGAVTNAVLWPAGTYAEGNGGYSSGSSVKTAVEANGFTNGLGLISYIGSSDWSAVAKELTYNGNSFSTNNVTQGRYTFWGYLHQLGHPGVVGTSAPTSVTKSFFTALETQVEADTTWLVRVSQMAVSRTSDGGLINPLL